MKRLIWIFGVMVLVASCAEEIEFDLNEDDQIRLVADVSFTNENIRHAARLTRTSSYFKDEVPIPVSGAEIVLSSPGQTVLWEESSDSAGWYFTTDSVAGLDNQTYHLEISEGGKKYESTDYLSPAPPLDSLTYRSFEKSSGGRLFVIDFWMQEPPEPGQQYLLKTHLNGVLDTDTVSEYALFDDDIVNGEYLDDIAFQVIEADYGDTIKVELFSISKAYYDGLFALYSETIFRGGFFDGPPSNVASNISNGAVGFFMLAGKSERTIILTEENEKK